MSDMDKKLSERDKIAASLAATARGGALRPEQLRALRALADYASHRFGLTRDELRRLSNMKTTRELSRVFSGGAVAHHLDVFQALKEYYTPLASQCDAWLQPTLHYLFALKQHDDDDEDTSGRFGDAGLLDTQLMRAANLTEKHISDFCARYAGKYRFFRYAADPLEPASGDKFRIIMGTLNILRPTAHQVAPRFEAGFEAARPRGVTETLSETGVVVPFNDMFLIFGIETHHQLTRPIIIYCRDIPWAHNRAFRGIVNRQHSNRSVIASKCLYVRNEYIPEQLLNASLFYLKESDMDFLKDPRLSIDFEDFRNVVESDGRSVLQDSKSY